MRWGLVPGILLLVAGSEAGGQVRREGVKVPMRDGVALSADLWLPALTGRFPLIVIRTPDGRKSPEVDAKGIGEHFAARGYAVLAQDVRGTGDSEGAFGYLFQEANDGFDTIEWGAVQAWSNGRVGTMGTGYAGAAQWLVAGRSKPPHLSCIAPTSSWGMPFDDFPHRNGIVAVASLLTWLDRIAQGAPGRLQVDWTSVRDRPLRALDSAIGRPSRLYREFLDHPRLDSYWGRIQLFDEDFAAMAVPSLTITGWFDENQPGALFYWRGMRGKSPAKDRQHLVVGPWNQAPSWSGGGSDQGGKAGVDHRAIHLAWFEHCLKASPSRFDFPRARLFITGSNRWVDVPEYPPVGGKPRALYVRSSGRATAGSRDGFLSWDPPGRESPDRFEFDPRDPAPSADRAGGFEQRTPPRMDVMGYTSPPLPGPLTILGPVKLDLYVASDGPDTDFTAKLIDVYPDGRSMMIGPRRAGFRARYRFGYQREVPLTPGRPTKLVLDLHEVAHTFLAGHRLRIEISSSAWPALSVNRNTGNPVATDTAARVARQMIFHDGQRASRLFLPVVPPPPAATGSSPSPLR